MLGESGGIATDRKGPEKGGAVRCWASHRGGWSYIVKVNRVSVSVLDNWGNSTDADGSRNFKRTIPFDKLGAVMTAAEVQQARADGRLIEYGDKTGFMLNDAPAPTPKPIEPKPDASPFDAMRESLKAGVQVVSAPQLFPTPRELAERMIEEADIQPGDRVLEPSAGTGMLLGAMGGKMFDGPYLERDQLYAVEINSQLAGRLEAEYPLTKVICGDFLEQNGNLGKFDRIVMNPPFVNGADIKHIQHARAFLKPGGKLVALCANGPRQKAALEPIADYWEDLPEGSFSAQGTNVNVALLVIHG
jgi:phospholipid N-methyltransferase